MRGSRAELGEGHTGGRKETARGREARGVRGDKHTSTGTITGAENLRKRFELGLTAKTFRQGRGGFAATLNGQEERR